ncbi:MAG TPA: fumarylacetoacetate hydrolase family protein [Hyphomicrobium zavarzinii]|nr:fumarylacetoacetate hydrolase family protein [Hyphomicrobium zavarzinii]
MKLRRILEGETPVVQIAANTGWVRVSRALAALAPSHSEAETALWSRDTIALLGAPEEVRSGLNEAALGLAPDDAIAGRPLLPFEPRSFRDFMLYERHAIDAARGFVRRFTPRAWPVVKAYEAVFRRPFPALRPDALWNRQPIYYMGNHLAFALDGEPLTIPSYTRALDYELELGFVLACPLYNATPEEAEAAIGGFVVVNDFSARDVQRAEMRSGFGPQKSKHFRNGISRVVVSTDEILPRWRELSGFVRLNGRLVAEPRSAGPRWSLGEALAHASRSERLYPGELFATGTLPGGSGIETGQLLSDGDTLEIGIEEIGSITTPIVAEETRR